MKKIIKIDSPARIHLGFINLKEKSERIYGSLGLAINKFRNIQKIESNKNFEIVTKNKEIRKRVEAIFKTFLSLYKLKTCKISFLESIPLHQGLGSGTQIALSTGILLSKFNNLNLNIHEISKLLGRGKRSGIGVETFSSGGFVVDSGKKKGSKFPPSKILRINWPKDWNIILLSDTNLEGLSGKKEQQEFSNLKKLTLNYVEENCFNVLMRIIPGIVEKDFNTFVTGIQKIQDNMSKIFYGSSQSFSSKGISSIFKLLKSQKILGYGQSSWGPTGFIFCKNLKEKKKLLQKIEKFIEFKKIKGINLVNVNGRNFGNTLKKSN